MAAAAWLVRLTAAIRAAGPAVITKVVTYVKRATSGKFVGTSAGDLIKYASQGLSYAAVVLTGLDLAGVHIGDIFGSDAEADPDGAMLRKAVEEVTAKVRSGTDDIAKGMGSTTRDTAGDLVLLQHARVLKAAFGSLKRAREIQEAFLNMKVTDFDHAEALFSAARG